MISAIIKATKPADARPLIDLSAPREMLPVAEAVRLLRRRRLLLIGGVATHAACLPFVRRPRRDLGRR